MIETQSRDGKTTVVKTLCGHKQHDRLKQKEREILLTIATNPMIVDMLKAFIVRVTIVNLNPLQVPRVDSSRQQNKIKKPPSQSLSLIGLLHEQHDED